jgi:hypothetical protein
LLSLHEQLLLSHALSLLSGAKLLLLSLKRWHRRLLGSRHLVLGLDRRRGRRVR